ncbi:ribosomal protein S12/S23 [Moesziomyces antarcticus]|uniref:ribosomal protein S12/S23 n=1 Tax=Pseudozyma antarctica TaxID=84753 RepID=UPI0007194FA4|nr:ribosomal protein S12/S23 [Moesziomyces antarcticus]GAK63147.1 ribosomal protein S12/S23 [Moesziomyces antarcticus]
MIDLAARHQLLDTFDKEGSQHAHQPMATIISILQPLSVFSRRTTTTFTSTRSRTTSSNGLASASYPAASSDCCHSGHSMQNPSVAPPFFKMAKPRGLNTARKQVSTRRDNRWADAAYKKRALGNFYKTSPTGGSSQAKGIVLEKIGVEAKQPNSAIRKCVRVQLIKNGKKVAAFVPNDGCLNFVDENDEVLISGFGRAGKAKGDIPGVRFKVVKVSGVGLLALFKSKKEKPRS